MSENNPKNRGSLITWLGFSESPDWTKAKPFGTVLGIVVIILMIGAVVAAGAVLFNTVSNMFSTQGPSLGAGTLIIGILGAPFLIWRTIVAQRTVDLTATALFNDKFANASADLAARREVTRSVITDDTESILTEWQDDIVTRSIAIDRMLGLAEERPEEASRIASLLCVYIRELSREVPPKVHPRAKFLELLEGSEDGPPLTHEQVVDLYGFSSDDATLDSLTSWARALEPARADTQKAAQVLGKLAGIKGTDFTSAEIDLRSANLQGFDLSGLNLKEAGFMGAHLEGANLRGAHLEEAFLWEAHLEGAFLWGAHLEEADLEGAHLEGANLRGAHLEGAFLGVAHLEGARLGGAHLYGAFLSEAHLEGADLEGAHLQGADLERTNLKGANFTDANLEGARLYDSTLDTKTNLFGASLKGAAILGIDFTDLPQIRAHVAHTFADASVILPGGVRAGDPDWPKHWPAFEIEADEDFDAEWEKWKADPENYQPPTEK